MAHPPEDTKNKKKQKKTYVRIDLQVTKACKKHRKETQQAVTNGEEGTTSVGKKHNKR